MAHYTTDDLCAAARRGKTGLMRSILTVVRPNSRDSGGMTALHWAAQYARPRVVELLLARGARVNMQSQQVARTPLHYAALTGCMESVQLLLGAGADPNIVTTDGLNSLHYAACVGGLAVALLLHERGASLHGGPLAQKNPVYRAMCKDTGGVLSAWHTAEVCWLAHPPWLWVAEVGSSGQKLACYFIALVGVYSIDCQM